MQYLMIIIMLIALHLLYRIAYPKRTIEKKENVASEQKTTHTHSVMGKSRFVMPDRSQSLQTPAISLGSENKEDKPPTFESESKEKQSVTLRSDKLDVALDDEPDPDELDFPADDDEEIDYQAEEEAEELNRVQGGEVMYAEGLDYDDLQKAKKVIKEQPEAVNEETGRTLAALENTDFFEMLVSGNEGKRNWIKAVIDRSIQNRMPETEDKTSGRDYGNFDVADFVVKRNKR